MLVPLAAPLVLVAAWCEGQPGLTVPPEERFGALPVWTARAAVQRVESLGSTALIVVSFWERPDLPAGKPWEPQESTVTREALTLAEHGFQAAGWLRNHGRLGTVLVVRSVAGWWRECHGPGES